MAKEKTEKQGEQKSTGKKVAGIILNVILWVFVAFCALITVLAFAQTSSSYNVPSIGNTTILTVSSDSMEPEFYKGDIITATKIDEAEAAQMQVGDIITYDAGDLTGDGIADLNTHRIISVNKDEAGNVIGYTTHGDNNPDEMNEEVSVGVVLCKYNNFRIPKLGSFLSFLQTRTGFLSVVVIPLVIFFLAELIIFVRKFLKVKNADKKQITAEEEELIKQKAVEEYLKAKQTAEEQKTEAPEEPAAEASEPADAAEETRAE